MATRQPGNRQLATCNFAGQVEKSPQVKLSICPMKLMRTGFKCLLDNLSCLLARLVVNVACRLAGWQAPGQGVMRSAHSAYG